MSGEIRNKKTGFAFLLLFVFYWCAITQFNHSHVIDGVVIVHSHPYTSGHSHTGTQLETIFFLSLFHSPDNVHIGLDLSFWLILLALIFTAYTEKYAVCHLSGANSRAPPVSL